MAHCSACNNRRYITIVKANTVPPTPGVVRPCPQCNCLGDESCCEGAVGGPYEVTNVGRIPEAAE
jgi:hypothetical protein